MLQEKDKGHSEFGWDKNQTGVSGQHQVPPPALALPPPGQPGWGHRAVPVAAGTQPHQPALPQREELDCGLATYRRSWATFSRSEMSTVLTTASAFFFICSSFFSIWGTARGDTGSEVG